MGKSIDNNPHMSERPPGCLIIHGFGGGRYEIEPLEKFLRERGYETFCPVLAGHEKTRHEMARAGYKDWSDSAGEGYDYLKEKCSRVIIIGFSMGGLIAVNLLKNKNVEALVTLSTPIWFWDFKIILSNIFKDLRNNEFVSIKRYLYSIFKIPITACLNFTYLLHKTRPMFKEINIPYLIIQGKKDDTARWKSADYIYSRIKSDIKELKYYQDAQHLICLSEENSQVFEDILEFLGKCCS